MTQLIGVINDSMIGVINDSMIGMINDSMIGVINVVVILNCTPPTADTSYTSFLF